MNTWPLAETDPLRLTHGALAVRRVAIAVPATALVLGALAGLRDPGLALLAAAVIFGWSQLAGA
jgi:hypothetical protein